MTNVSMFEPIRYRIRVVTVLPPSGVPGDIYIFNNQLYIWNSSTLSWQIVGDLPESNTDVGGAVNFTNFTTGLWVPVQQTNLATVTITAAGALFRTTSAAAAQTCNYNCVVFCTKSLLPNLAGLIDVEWAFDQCFMETPNASEVPTLGGWMSLGQESCIGGGCSSNSIFTHAEYVCMQSTTLATPGADMPGNMGTSSGDQATHVTGFTFRMQLQRINVAGTWRQTVLNTAATFSHNGGAPAALGGAQSTLQLDNAWTTNRGYQLALGYWNRRRINNAGYGGRLVRFTLHAGRLV